MRTWLCRRVHYRIGKYRIVLKSLDDSTQQRAEWDPGQTTINAKLAAQDPTTIGYVGEFNSGASAISIPILNRLGIPQISPASTAVGLTSSGPGSAPGEPEKYYPTGVRTFARVVPSDAVQAQAQVRMQESEGCTKTYVLDDGEVDGHDSATSFTLAAQRSSIRVVGSQSFDPKATDYSSLPTAIATTGANCVLISAITESNAVAVTKQIAQSLPHVKLFGSAGVGESTFTDSRQGGIPDAIDPRVLISVPTLDPSAYPASAQAFYAAYTRAYGTPQPYAIYGYEAMSLMLNSIARATDGGRDAGRPFEGRKGAVRDPRSPQRARDLQHRARRRHHLAAVRRLSSRRRPIVLLEGDRRLSERGFMALLAQRAVCERSAAIDVSLGEGFGALAAVRGRH